MPPVVAETTRQPGRTATRPDRFGRMFRLPAFADVNSEQVRDALLELGKPAGILQAGSGDANPDNPNIPAGFTFFGQFLDHDMTFDPASPLGRPTSVSGSVNVRTPALDLDTVYGRGPVVDPQLYADQATFLVESGGRFEDLPRTAKGTALIGDPRNDENMMIAGLQMSFLKFHNAVAEMVREDDRGLSAGARFSRAQRLVRWHYQWIILNEFLPTILGPKVVQDIRQNGRRFFTPSRSGMFIPVEFQGAAYRFGHSMVRPGYRANNTGNNGEPFAAALFNPEETGKDDPNDLRGGFRAERRFIDWQNFFDFGLATPPQRNKKMDTHISPPLFQLPLSTIPNGEPPQSLMQRNLLRHLTWSLPSGQRISQAMGITPLPASDLSELKPLGAGMDTSTPLFYYILKEAEVKADGLTLGPMGGRLIGEVFIGLLQLDQGGFLTANPRFRPSLPSATRGDFKMTDLLKVAGVDPDSRAKQG